MKFLKDKRLLNLVCFLIRYVFISSSALSQRNCKTPSQYLKLVAVTVNMYLLGH